MSPISQRTDDSVRLGVLFASGAAVALPVMDGLVKSLVIVYPVLMAYLLLHERPDVWGWAAIAASLLGVFLVIRPSSRMFELSALYVVGAAFAYAAFSLITRVLARHDGAHVTTLWSALVALLLFSLTLPEVWMPIQQAADLHLLLAVGLLGTVGQLLFSRAFRHTRIHVIAPISYLSLLVALALGWMVFGEVPDGWSILGMSLIAAAALAVAISRTQPAPLRT